MISSNDALLLLTELQEEGKDVKPYINKVLASQLPPLEVLKYINDNRQLDVAAFYEHIRKNYNKKKSDLYINIVKEVKDPEEVLTTLSAMLTQILLFSKRVKDRELFLNHSRAAEIAKVLKIYFETYDLTYSLKLLKLIKADILALETIAGRRSS